MKRKKKDENSFRPFLVKSPYGGQVLEVVGFTRTTLTRPLFKNRRSALRGIPDAAEYLGQKVTLQLLGGNEVTIPDGDTITADKDGRIAWLKDGKDGI